MFTVLYKYYNLCFFILFFKHTILTHRDNRKKKYLTNILSDFIMKKKILLQHMYNLRLV